MVHIKWLGTIAVSETHNQVVWNTTTDVRIGPVIYEQVLVTGYA